MAKKRRRKGGVVRGSGYVRTALRAVRAAKQSAGGVRFARLHRIESLLVHLNSPVKHAKGKK